MEVLLVEEVALKQTIKSCINMINVSKLTTLTRHL